MSEAAESGPVSIGPLRLLIPSAALLWGLQYALLNPALAYLLVRVYRATAGEVGWILGVYGAGAFLASLIMPRYAARRPDSLRPVLLAGCLSLLLALVLGLVGSLPVTMIALIVLGGPAAIGSTLLHAHLERSGVGLTRLSRLRVLVCLAWVVGPPLAALIIGVFGPRSVVVALALIAVLNIATTMFLMQLGSTGREDLSTPTGRQKTPVGPVTVVIVLGSVALQASSVAAMSIMMLFVVETLRLDIGWAGVALGLAAMVQVLALLVIGGARGRISRRRMVISGCLAGVVYGAGMTLVQGPMMLLVLQILNGWFIAALSGVGLLIVRPGGRRSASATGLHDHTRRIGVIVAGPVIALSAVSSLGYRGVFLGCVVLAMTGLGCVLAASLLSRSEPAR